MGIITLTDRISVSVRAKNETESNSQKRATGKNIANALGNGNISDDLADQLGNTSKPTIADEQGREWVSMSDIIAAGKKMQQEGAFDGPEYDDYVHNGYHFLRTNSLIIVSPTINEGSVTINGERLYNVKKHIVEEYSAPSGLFSTMYLDKNRNLAFGARMTANVDESFHIKTSLDYFEIGYINVLSESDTSSKYYNETRGEDASNLIPDAGTLQTGVLSRSMVDTLLQEEPVAHHGGSLINWTKPDDEIEEDIRNLHETWDVSEHAGSVNANGTYVLAGPIEFNPGD